MIALSADVGGTFTDLVLADGRTGASYADKVPTTPGSTEALTLGIRRLCKQARIDPADITSFVHGFTIATNAWLTRSGARVALVVTAGFRDILEIGTQRRPETYSLTQRALPSLVPRSSVVELHERIGAGGEIVTVLTEEELDRCSSAVAALQPEAVAVCLLFSHVNDAHERAVLASLERCLPDVPVYLSSVINPEAEEYPRANTTVTAAYVGPAVDRYIRRLETDLPAIGLTVPILLMRSDGGVSTVRAARANPSTMLLSGPAGGVVAGTDVCRQANVPDLVTFDMGGTSADFSLLIGGESRMATSRMIKGQILRVASLDIHTISAGGGSLGWVDPGGALRVGPASAGSVPGPACYATGGERPTLTDAALLLGLLDPDRYLDGRMRLDTRAALRAIDDHVARPLGLQIQEAAFAMIAIANAQMAQAIRSLSVERGHDVRQFALLSFGGAGSLFAPFLIRELGMREMLVPARPGVLSADGLLLSDMRYAFQRPFVLPLDDVEASSLQRAFAELAALAADAFDRDSVDAGAREVRPLVDVRFREQMHRLTVPIDPAVLQGRWSARRLFETFCAQHRREYGFADDTIPAEIVNLRVEAIGRVTRPRASPHTGHSRPPTEASARTIYLGPRIGHVEARVVDRRTLSPGAALPGPAIITQPDTTILILPGQTGRVTPAGLLTISEKEQSGE